MHEIYAEDCIKNNTHWHAGPFIETANCMPIIKVNAHSNVHACAPDHQITRKFCPKTAVTY